MGWFCGHQWTMLSEIISESDAQHIMKVNGFCANPVNDLQLRRICERRLIQLATCTKCGAIQKFVTSIP